jgi:hypothetical protein
VTRAVWACLAALLLAACVHRAPPLHAPDLPDPGHDRSPLRVS